ncbi:unnamed protein product [Blepharisma stoltei]|uniref:Uncharacterized protein n=1 Tax=Blepharisma stoltei TaxID=1481888 RepID=A0AAU9I443_9CILI|nr:unnamed protein product [Blepharisma stoltei]
MASLTLHSLQVKQLDICTSFSFFGIDQKFKFLCGQPSFSSSSMQQKSIVYSLKTGADKQGGDGDRELHFISVTASSSEEEKRRCSSWLIKRIHHINSSKFFQRTS